MSLVVVGVADYKIANDPGDTIVTYALGSCIAVAIHDAVAGVAGMLHFMLPESAIDPSKAAANPAMFADTGLPAMFRAAYQKGAEKRRLRVWAAGGAQVMDDGGVFNIGKRNQLALRKILWKAGVMVTAEELGGTESRTARLDLSTGRFLLRTGGMAERELTVAAGRARGGALCHTGC